MADNTCATTFIQKTLFESGSLRKNPDLPELPLIAIAGPTGCGKSELALRVAEEFHGEVVNCDSLQIYRHFDIGTAKLPEASRRGIAHHLIDIAEPHEVFTAGDFARVGRPVLQRIAESGHLPIVTGGTGFYLRALLEGLAPGPQRNEGLRERLRAKENRRPGTLHRILARLDRATSARIHANDIPKLMRALEICISARRTATEVFAAGRDALQGFRILKIGVFPDREELYKRLEQRTKAMFAAGLMEETQSILALGYGQDCKPFESIGYKQALQSIRGELSPQDALFYATRETRRYAKRQMTWFRQDRGMEIFRGFGDDPQFTQQVLERIRMFLACAPCAGT
ncbi:MAG: tRNA (adenosine(37)-N6)-dimethylallyltransferase MiaA [Acidobacteriota bacterium]|nr:tRNA (adenosine(37)-N6)-dimethylallyltransferase MiaA [Acidobacteriota bacterium]